MTYKTRKRIWPVSLVAVIGMVAVLAALAATALMPGATQAQGAPPPVAGPSGLRATANSATEIMLQWNRGLGQTSYEVQRAAGDGTNDASFANIADDVSGTATSYRDSGLTPNTEYSYRVRGVSSGGPSPWSNIVTFTTPGTVASPTGVAAAHGGQAGQVVVEWTELDDVDSYTVTYRDTSGTTVTRDSADAESPHTISNLMAETAYQVCVIAVVGGNQSAPACDTATTSRYELTFDQRQFGSPQRTDDSDIKIEVALNGEVTVRATVWVPDPIESSDETDTVAVRFTSDPANLEVTTANLLAVSENSIDDGELTIRPRDGDKRSFQVSFACVKNPTVLTVSIYDDDVQQVEIGKITVDCGPKKEDPPEDRTDVSDLFTVASYGDWEYHDVTDGFILDVSDGNRHRVNAHYHDTGRLSRDEPVVVEDHTHDEKVLPEDPEATDDDNPYSVAHEGYTLGVSEYEELKNMADGSPRRAQADDDLTRQQKNAYVEEGQRTIEVLAGQPHVQLTVTSKKDGPVYIRFLDSNMRAFGTDVDEEDAWRGADVVGLDSQGRLALNNQVVLTKALALAFDQYEIVTPGQATQNSYLAGVPSAMDTDGNYIKDYNQGAFRFFNPCPEVGHHFYVQVYEATGKYLRTTEKVVCVDSPRPGPTGLQVTLDSQEVGEGELTYRHALNADSHTVLLVDAHSRTIVEDGEIEDAPEMVRFGSGIADIGPELNDGWRYHFIVVAHGLNNQYTADAITVTAEWINNADAAPSTLTAGDPTRSHIVCQTENAEVMALLADCDVNMAPMAPTATLAAQTVMAGSTAMVQSTINDTDMGDTLSWEWSSSDTAIATVMMDATDGSMATVTGVAAGSATITVTATDSMGETAMQTIMVTVTPGALGAPTDVMATVDDSDPGDPGIMVTWTDAANADVHDVGLIDLSDYSVYREVRIAGVPSAMTHTFDSVASGRYMAIVVSTSPTDPTDYKYGVSIVMVP